MNDEKETEDKIHMRDYRWRLAEQRRANMLNHPFVLILHEERHGRAYLIVKAIALSRVGHLYYVVFPWFMFLMAGYTLIAALWGEGR